MLSSLGKYRFFYIFIFNHRSSPWRKQIFIVYHKSSPWKIWIEWLSYILTLSTLYGCWWSGDRRGQSISLRVGISLKFYFIVYCPVCRTYLIATRFWVVVICPIIKCLTVLEFSFLLFDLCLFITIFNFILNYVPIVTFWIFTYHKIWILLIIFCFIWNYWIIYFLTCLEVFWSVVSLLWPWLIKWK